MTERVLSEKTAPFRGFAHLRALDDLAVEDLDLRTLHGVAWLGLAVVLVGILAGVLFTPVGSGGLLSGRGAVLAVLAVAAACCACIGPLVHLRVSRQRRILAESVWTRIPCRCRLVQTGRTARRILLVPDLDSPDGRVVILRATTKRRLVRARLDWRAEIDVAGDSSRGVVARIPGETHLLSFRPVKAEVRERHFRRALR